MSMYQDEGESWQPPAQGVIPDDNSGAAPVEPDQASAIPDDNSGAAPVTPAQAQPQQQVPGQDISDWAGSSSNPLSQKSIGETGQNVKRIMAYLLGGTAGGGADPETAKKFAIPDKHKGASDDDANLLAVQKAFEMGGPEAAWAMVQFNRGAYNANSAIAKHVANIVGGKDDHAAAEAATKASAHMLDGSAVHYTAANGGFLATIRMPGTSQVVQIPLGREAFAQAVDPMGEGQYDKVIEQGGMPAHLQRMAKSNVGSTPSSQGGDLSGGERPSQYPVNPAEKDKDGNVITPAYQTKGPGFNSAKEEQSRRIFPWISQEGQRNAFLAGQEEKQAERDTKETVAKETGIARNKTAAIQAGGHVQGETIKAGARVEAARFRSEAENQKIAARLQEAMMKSKDRAAHEAAANLRTKYLNPQIALTPEDESLAKEILGAGRPSTPAAAPPGVPHAAQAPQAKTPTGEAPPAPGMKKFQGQWYTEQQYKQKFGH